MPDQPNDRPSAWEWVKPRLLDAGVVAAGTATGMTAAAAGMQALQNTRVGNWWNSLPPQAKLKYLAPAIGVGALSTAGMSLLRDYYRYNPELDKEKTAESVEPSPDGGNYMAVSNLRSMQTNSSDLLGMVDASTALPDWVESKLTQSASSLDDVADWMRNGGEANKLAARQLLYLSRLC